MILKKLALTSAVAAAIFAAQYSTPAHANAATDVGIKIGEKVASLILGEVFSSIFDKGDPAATPQQVQDIVNNGFNKAAMDEIDIQLSNVMSSISDYNYTLSYTTNLTTVESIRNSAGAVQSAVAVKMSNGNFMQLAKTYITATNVRLAFLSERRRYIKLKGEKAVVAGEMTAAELTAQIAEENRITAQAAFDSLTDLAKFFYAHFYDTTPHTQGCLYKYPETPWVSSRGLIGQNKDTIGVDRSTVTCRNYKQIPPVGAPKDIYYTSPAGAIMMYGAPISPGNEVPFNSTDIMEVHKNEYRAFSIKKYANLTGPFALDFHMLVVKGDDLARYVRNLNLITKYPNELGDVESQVISWIDIIAAYGNNDQLVYAMRKATQIGVLQNKLTDRYKARHAAAVASQEQWFKGKLNEWGLAQTNAPTRIEFSTTNHYPTDAPAWLADAMN
ncbi:hypothetical protein ACFOEE_07350 [Pseudoalteromonas fenneropenaei]|uniref:Uncharacterized protein n=1 Tax=Pseudoalteromonas fenneropenaei TaxID=1737459 RepID=A0ABV7CIA0_9GAMM